MPKPRATPADISPAIARMRQIASQSGDALLLAGGPVQPDHVLLELLAEALEHLTAARKAFDARPPYRYHDGGPTPEERRLDEYLMAEFYRHKGLAAGPMSKARKMRATTPTGIYAKALCVRSSRDGAAAFAMSLAEDLVNCRELRASLWPADAVSGGEGVT